MDRIWQWAWDRYPTRYMWAICVIAFVVSLAVYLPVSFLVVAFEKSDRYVESAVVTVVAVPLLVCVMAVPGVRWMRLAQRWAAGDQVDQMMALEGTYSVREEGGSANCMGHRRLACSC